LWKAEWPGDQLRFLPHSARNIPGVIPKYLRKTVAKY
jgi:hypothetical protein